MGSWRENLKLIFGSDSVFRMMLPSTRALPYDGTYWPDKL